MADRIYLSLWYPDFRTASLAPALLGVLRQFAVIGAAPQPSPHIRAVTIYPISWAEPPVYQRIYDRDRSGSEAPEDNADFDFDPDPDADADIDPDGGRTAFPFHSARATGAPDPLPESAPEIAVPSAFEALYDDFAYEFEIAWELWSTGNPSEPEDLPAESRADHREPAGSRGEPRWQRRPHLVRIVGFGPEFDDGAYEQNGHIRLDLGLDSAFLQDDVALDPVGAHHIRENVQRLVDLTNAVQKNCGIATRLLWSESGESLAQKLVARLQQVN